jgi:peptidoglycan/xylan/chitin deacetylase (PgdA/CDA1 family)
MSGRRTKAGVRLKLAGLALIGICSVSIPVTLAVVFSTTGASDILTIGTTAPRNRHATAAAQLARMRCTPTRGRYALTFDDGPDARTTARLVAAIRRTRAVATFFDVGRRAAALPGLVEEQRRVGQVANHGYTDTPLSGLSHERRLQELRVTARTLDYPNAFFRPPSGASSPEADADVRLSGLVPVYWTVDTGDLHASADQIVERALTVRPGGILLLHDGVEETIAALPRIVAGLSRHGLCPGLLARTAATVRAPGGISFHVEAVAP